MCTLSSSCGALPWWEDRRRAHWDPFYKNPDPIHESRTFMTSSPPKDPTSWPPVLITHASTVTVRRTSHFCSHLNPRQWGFCLAAPLSLLLSGSPMTALS